ncbi:hypothetical protein D0544_04820 [Aestuariirhabdus litorea]|uniref:Uncharacterized protein n=1 Tax=Aestuariirhabdus litorea TaxID=2528527 RepID=A0A3P3VNV0_9GAMM|nr:hypothetical protein D0544_04820 [Aestuariirhabdus litorea]
MIEHLHYHCPLYCWLSSARYREGEAVVFLYIEYRDATRASRYRQWRFASIEQAQQFLGQQASTVVLPQISGLRTRQQPITGPAPDPAATAA